MDAPSDERAVVANVASASCSHCGLSSEPPRAGASVDRGLSTLGGATAQVDDPCVTLESCPNCGEVVELNATQRPLTHVEHEAMETAPRVFVMIDAGGWMLHRCVVEDD